MTNSALSVSRLQDAFDRQQALFDKISNIGAVTNSALSVSRLQDALLRMIGQFGNMKVVFDTVNRKGMAMMQKKYMRQVGHADAQMFFYVDAVEELAAKIGGNAKVIADEPYYRYIPKNGLKMSTKVSMAVSDRFCMVKMIQLKL